MVGSGEMLNLQIEGHGVAMHAGQMSLQLDSTIGRDHGRSERGLDVARTNHDLKMMYAAARSPGYLDLGLGCAISFVPSFPGSSGRGWDEIRRAA